jgi:SAM-dependent methyltransferase
MADDRWWKDLDAVVAATLAGGSRILDLGCGDGGLVDRLTELGFDAIGVDPHAPAHPRLIQARVEHATGVGEFDAITATMALHHAELPPVLEAIDGHLRPDGRLFVSELAWDAYDERAAGWLANHAPSDADNSIASWRREYGDLHTWAAVREALSTCFTPILVLAVRGSRPVNGFPALRGLHVCHVARLRQLQVYGRSRNRISRSPAA